MAINNTDAQTQAILEQLQQGNTPPVTEQPMINMVPADTTPSNPPVVEGNKLKGRNKNI